MVKKPTSGSKKLLTVFLAFCLVVSCTALFTACSSGTAEEPASSGSGAESTPAPSEGTIRLATTTSTKDSGLLDALLPVFTDETGYEVEVISVGSGEAIALGEAGEADVLLVHSPTAEATFVEEGNADETGRLDVMYNDFVVIGPSDDPAGVTANAANDAVGAFTDVAGTQSTFISRGDESGTHVKEMKIWEKADIDPVGESWYIIAGDGMGAVITMANEKLAYTLSDRATWLANAAKTELVIVCEKDPSGILNNQYGVICVNPDKNTSINHDGAVAFQEWITSPEAQELIGEYGVDEYGEALFVPNAA